MKTIERILWALLACAGLVVFNELFSADATQYSFSPDTLEVRYQKVKADGVTLWPRGHTKYSSTVLEFLIDNKYVQPIPTDHPRWISLGCFSSRWRDGQGALMYVFVWRQTQTIEWCQEDPERAKLLWSTVFPLLRSSDKQEVRAGEEIAHGGVRNMSREELRQFINETLLGHGISTPMASAQ